MLKGLGLKKGDRVAIYMPMIPELVIAMLGCARIGATHSIIFGGFSADAVAAAGSERRREGHDRAEVDVGARPAGEQEPERAVAAAAL